MADNYTQFSEALYGITGGMKDWINHQLEEIEVAETTVKPDGDPDCTIIGPRLFLEKAVECELDFDNLESTGFEWSWQEVSAHSCYMNIQDDGGNCNFDHLICFIQSLFREFNIDKAWVVSWACTCSKPRHGEFDGGSLAISAKAAEWQGARWWAEQQAKVLTGTPQDRWENDELQFARIVGELASTADRGALESLGTAMDVSQQELAELLERGLKEWDRLKALR